MSGLKNLLRKAARAPGVPQARHVTERAVAPYLRADVHSLHQDQLALVERIEHLERVLTERSARVDEQIGGMAKALDNFDHHQPAVFNALASTNGTVRLLRRELELLRAGQPAGNGVAATYDDLDASVQRISVELEVLRRRVEELVAARLPG